MSSKGGPHFFSEARNVVISGGTFTNVYSPSNSTRSGLDRLLRNISEGAFHNAAERGSPPRCHPNTRQAIRAEIMEWVKAPSSMRKLILWMYGPAGSGKTAIAQSIAEECEGLGLLAASFFFWRTAAGRNDASRFVATLAYQLSRHIPQLEDPILTAIEQDPTIFSRSLSAQMQVLVITPLRFAGPSLTTPIFVIVDGFDECGPDGQSQSDLLHLLGTVTLELQQIPLILLIASRPEYEIRRAFNGNLLNPLQKVIVLDKRYKPDKDIRRYFDSTFETIYEEHRQIGRRLPTPWPTASDVDFLVSKASGQFIFAETILKFIDSPRHNPVDRLNSILHLSDGVNGTPFTLLDKLYRFILDSVVDIEKVLQVLAFLLLADDYERRVTVDEVEDLLGFEVRGALVDMHSLMSVPAPGSKALPQIYHASLGDFLMDRSRSGNYYIDASQGHVYLCRRWLKVIGIHPQSRTLRNWVAVQGYIRRSRDYAIETEMLNDLASLDLKASLEGMWDLARDLHFTDWDSFFVCVKQQAGDRDDVFPRLQDDFDAFIFSRIAQYPVSIRTHIPILLCPQFHRSSFYILDVLLRGTSESAEELQRLQILDRSLLGVILTYELESNQYIEKLVQDVAKAGEYCVDAGSYAALAKAIVCVMCKRPEEMNDQRLSWANLEEIGDPTYTHWFSKILEKASTNLDLAYFLSERAVQFKKDMRSLRDIAKASVKYIQRCGIPFLVHTHQPDMDECGICLWCNNTSVMESTSLSGLDATDTAGPRRSSRLHKPTTTGSVLVKDPMLLPSKRVKAAANASKLAMMDTNKFEETSELLTNNFNTLSENLADLIGMLSKNRK